MKQKNHQPVKIKNKIPLVETKLQKVCKNKEPLKKDLIIQLANLQENYENLEDKFKKIEKENKNLHIENKENTEKIKCMQRQIENYKKDKPTITKQTQTERGIELKCTECNFEALTNTELSWHMGEVHGWSEDQRNDEIDMEAGPRYCGKCNFEAANGYELDGHIWSEHDENDCEPFTCQICDKTFPLLKDLMRHKKNDHKEKVSLCWNFANGSCIYGEKNCWYNHNESASAQTHTKCSICGETFTSIGFFKRHMKSEHTEKVKECNKYKEGCCSYLDNCWFIHENLSSNNVENNENKNENNNDMARLFDIVEKYTEKVLKIEEMVKKNSV